MKLRPLVCIIALLLTGLTLWFAFHAAPVRSVLPGVEAPARHLLRIWVCSSVGGGESWLRDCLKSWEKQNPGTMTFLRVVSPEELTRPDAVLPDVLLYTPGTITAPQELFVPLSNAVGIREPLLRAGRWQMQQYGLPLCYAGYALAIDSSIEPELAVTPSPTTLLGKPAATAAPQATVTPELPENVLPLAPRGCGLFTLGCLMEQRPPLESTLTTAEVYRQFQSRQAAAALLTTGQITALSGVFPFRVLTPGEVITDQVWLASVTADAPPEAALLLAFLTSTDAQKDLSVQGLQTVRRDVLLYAAGLSSKVESAARQLLSAINAYIAAEEVHSAAWQFFTDRITLNDALLPLM